MKKMLLTFLLMLLPGLAAAQFYDDVVEARILPGWRLSNGDHMAALHLKLAPGWKTYWRSPGDAGIPPQFDWSGARNMSAIGIYWPAPHVFWQENMRSVGYKGEVILPLKIRPNQPGKDARLGGVVDIGICKDVCLPHRLRVSATLPAAQTKPDARIAAAMADVPFGAEDAGVTGVSCRITPQAKGLGLTVSIAMPRGTGREETVIETSDPNLWVADPRTSWQDGRLVAQTRVTHMSGGVFALDRSGLRITILGGNIPVELTGCSG
ncbi:MULTISPECIES: protein-disulfide reductase DsbD domain-containing protein [unclassified Mameliella]|uniref:protein-disulfide reductase DsbD domain-containing protein n=1 Tax=unclassified Mameliella TaxID=2630630 RepID=UPI00273E70C6|nr:MULTISPECIES: protein-disulfide reductase DsbD domain-containing protein [unclassified Mameliella]